MPRWMKIIVGLYAAFCAVALAIVFAAYLNIIPNQGVHLLGGIMAFAAALPWAIWLIPVANSQAASYVVIVGSIAANVAILSGIGCLIGRWRQSA